MRSRGRQCIRLLIAVSIFIAIASPSQGGTLIFHEVSTTPGLTMLLPSPAADVFIDVDVRPQTAEGGGFYGFSEIQILATGDLVITNTGFGCQATSCLFAPSPFINGSSVTATGGDDLGGSFAASEDVLTFSVTGTNGYVVISSGEYIDATGPSGDPGDPQTVMSLPLVQVPEPSPLSLLLPGIAALAALTVRRKTACFETG